MRIVRILAVAIILCFATAQPMAAAGADSRGSHEPVYYLSLGDSLAAGVQPIGPASRDHRTNMGYADQLWLQARSWVPGLQLVKLGCPGESTGTMIDGGRCPFPHGTQLAEAVSFLQSHRGAVAFVTIDIGFNDFPCDTDLSCLQPGVASIQANLPVILGTLRAAAGPGTPIVGMNIYDPFLASWLQGPDGQAFATMSVWQAVLPLNDLLEGIYAAFGSPVADVESAFHTTDFSIVATLPGVGPIPRNVALICLRTWLCAPAPLGPDRHANVFGYHAMADAFAAVLRP